MKIQKLLLPLFILFIFNQTFSQQTETTEEEVVEIQEIDASEDEYYEDVPFAVIEVVPVFPGCEGSNQEKKNCFNKNIQKHVRKKFDTSIVDSLGLSPGKKKIFIQFKITKKGDVEIIGVRAPHKKLEKEATRIVKLLPKMKPGEQRGKPVNVPYMLPISFNVVGKTELEKNKN